MGDLNTNKWKDVVEGVEVEVLEFDDSVESVEKASLLSGEPPSAIVKTLLLRIRNDYIIVIARGDRRIDFKKAMEALGSKVSLANPKEVREVLGVEPGAITPLSKKAKRLRIIFDPAIFENDFILCGGGSLNRLYKLKLDDLLQYLKPEVIDIFK